MTGEVGTGEGEREPPLILTPTGIVVCVMVGGQPFGEAIGERVISADARFVARQILDAAEALLGGRAHIQ